MVDRHCQHDGNHQRENIMSIKSLGNPFSSKTDLRHAADCGCHSCKTAAPEVENSIDLSTSEGMMERAVESAIVRSVFGQSGIAP